MTDPQAPGVPSQGQKDTSNLQVFSQDLSRYSVVVADDDLSNRMLLKSLLKSSGIRIWEAENGAEALSLCREKKPSFAVLDLKMPEMGGREAAEILRASQEFRNLPIIVMTAATPEELELAQTDHTLWTGYLLKPVTKSHIMNLISRILPLDGDGQSPATNDPQEGAP